MSISHFETNVGEIDRVAVDVLQADDADGVVALVVVGELADRAVHEQSVDQARDDLLDLPPVAALDR